MNQEQCKKVLELYSSRLDYESTAHSTLEITLKGVDQLDYVRDSVLPVMFNWADDHIDYWEATRKEKFMRWLGFVQGVLWVNGVYTIDEMREHNR